MLYAQWEQLCGYIGCRKILILGAIQVDIQLSKESQLDWLHRQISGRLDRFDSSRNWYRSRYYWYQVSAVFLGALITILSGLKLETPIPGLAQNITLVFGDAVLVLGALSTVLAALGAFFSPQQSWHLNGAMYSRMRALEAKLEMAERSSTFLG